MFIIIHLHGIAQCTRSTWNDRNLVNRGRFGLFGRNKRMSDLMIGNNQFFFIGKDTVFLLISRNNNFDTFFKVCLSCKFTSVTNCTKCCFIDNICKFRVPTFDPMSSSAVSASSNAYWNRVTQNPYTPGSTFKLVTAAAQLRVNPSAQTMQVNCTGNLTVDGQIIHDYGSASHGAIDLKTAFMRSCNNAFAQYALSMGDKALREAAESFGFNDNFLFRDLVVENSIYPTTSRSNFNIAMSGFGQSAITATPMHLCLLAAAVANKGVMMEPVLIDRVASPSGVTRYTRSSRVYRTAMTEGQAAILAEYMRAVVTSGTGTRAAVSGMIICGKTGSAETSLNGRAITNGLFIGFAQDVPYALCVVVEDIDDGQGGGSTAAPIARDIFAYLKNMQ